MNFYKILSYVRAHTKKSLLFLSTIILLLDLTAVALNYFYSKNTLLKTLTTKAENHQRDFGIMLEMTYTNMMQMAQFIGNDQYLNQQFLAGKKALEAGPNANNTLKAQEARQKLLKRVKPAWDKLTTEFNVRQLHYHLGPGSTSFLRVHRPEKFGDNMDTIRHTIVDTNAEGTSRTGYETGRIYGGLRAVYPISTEDPDRGYAIHVGALEVGTSFDRILPIFSNYYSVNTAVMLTKQHVEARMWPEFVQKTFGKDSQSKYYLESSSSELANQHLQEILNKINLTADFTVLEAQLIKLDEQEISVYYFPLRDYQGEKNQKLDAAGFIILWEDVSPLVADFHHSVWMNIIYALLGFIFIEVLLLWIFKRELRLVTAEHKATYDSLTGIYNRRYYDEAFKGEFVSARRAGREVSILVCDIDQFKKYNDFYGHQKGDECLKEVANCLQKSLVRNIDWIARYGGEEFVVVLPDTDLKGAVNVAQRLKDSVEALKIPHGDSALNEFVTVSIGAASSSEVNLGDSLFDCADLKLYRAKNSGRNKIES